MPETYRIAEVVIYALLNYLPLAIVAIYLFRNSLRFALPVLVGVMSLLGVLQIGIGIWAAFFPGKIVGVISLVSTVLYGIFYVCAVREPLGKTLFVLFFLSNIENYIVLTAKCLEGLLFPELAVQSYRWSFSVTLAIITLVLALPLYFYLRKAIYPALKVRHALKEWNVIWLAPVMFYFIWYCSTYLIRGRSPLEIALRPRNIILFSIINFGSCLIYYILSKVLLLHQTAIELEEKNRISQIEMLQYQELYNKIEEARRTRHDIRHHAMLLNDYVKHQEYEKLEAYLSSYLETLVDTESIRLCENRVLNILLLYYARSAKEHGIEFIVHSEASEHSSIEESNLSVLLGNLLENALAACIIDTGVEKKIVVGIREMAHSFCLTVDNTFHGELPQRENDGFLSTKHSGCGIGITSVKNIAERYQGSLDIKQKQHMVYVSDCRQSPELFARAFLLSKVIHN